MFSAFSPLNGGDLSTYYRDNEYPYDLNGSLDYTRPATMPPAIYPTIPTIGWIQGLVPLYDSLTLSMMYGDSPTGVWVGQVPSPSQMDLIFPAMSGGLVKMGA